MQGGSAPAQRCMSPFSLCETRARGGRKIASRFLRFAERSVDNAIGTAKFYMPDWDVRFWSIESKPAIPYA